MTKKINKELLKNLKDKINECNYSEQIEKDYGYLGLYKLYAYMSVYPQKYAIFNELIDTKEIVYAMTQILSIIAETEEEDSNIIYLHRFDNKSNEYIHEYNEIYRHLMKIMKIANETHRQTLMDLQIQQDMNNIAINILNTILDVIPKDKLWEYENDDICRIVSFMIEFPNEYSKFMINYENYKNNYDLLVDLLDDILSLTTILDENYLYFSNEKPKITDKYTEHKCMYLQVCDIKKQLSETLEKVRSICDDAYITKLRNMQIL